MSILFRWDEQQEICVILLTRKHISGNTMLYSELTETDQQALWSAFEKRFPLGLSKEFLLREAHLESSIPLESSWQSIFEGLQHEPRLFTKLLKSAVEMRPDDSNLCEVVEILCPPQKITLFVSASSAVSLGILFSLFVPTDETGNAFEQVDSIEVEYASLEPIPYIFDEEEEVEIITPVQEPILLADGGLEERTTRILPPQLVEPESQPLLQLENLVLAANDTQPLINQDNNDRCTFEGNGQIIGYWYAGAEPPIVHNGWTTIPHGRNVRLDFPEKHNHYNARTQVQCILIGNTQVPMQDEPILVAGGKYWIPLRSVSQG